MLQKTILVFLATKKLKDTSINQTTVCVYAIICHFVLRYFYVVFLNEQNILMVVCATILLAIVSLWLQRNSPVTKKYQVPLGFVRKVFNCTYGQKLRSMQNIDL